jgi:hypothetical protein
VLQIEKISGPGPGKVGQYAKLGERRRHAGLGG